jgi:hypothetical protein
VYCALSLKYTSPKVPKKARLLQPSGPCAIMRRHSRRPPYFPVRLSPQAIALWDGSRKIPSILVLLRRCSARRGKEGDDVGFRAVPDLLLIEICCFFWSKNVTSQLEAQFFSMCCTAVKSLLLYAASLSVGICYKKTC